MRNFLFVIYLCLGLASSALWADTFTLSDGASLAGDIVKSDGAGVMLHAADEVYTNIAWGRFSQDSLKKLAADPKFKEFAEPFILPDESQRPQKAEIAVNPVKRMIMPANPSLFGGFFTSGLGLFLLFVVYVANLYAAYEISIVKARPAAQVIGVAAILPIIGPVIFLIKPMYVAPEPEAEAEDAAAAEVAAAQHLQPEVQVTDVSDRPPEPKKQEPQIFARGKFTFNKRFIETRFADFAGTASGPLTQKYTMEVKTMKDQFHVERIAQINQMDVIFETSAGQRTVPVADIQEIKLNPKPAA